ncbi:MAG TPA: hypothetical protein VGB79_13085 [Allosphingosinicella sp.]
MARETPTAPASSGDEDGEKEKSPTQKAHEERIARLEREKEVYDAQKALRDARAAAATSALGPLGAVEGQKGTVTVDDGARSVLEATLLASVALGEASDEMAPRLCQAATGRDAADCRVASRPIVPSAEPPQAARAAVTQMTHAEMCAELATPAADLVLAGEQRPIVIVPEATKALIDAAELFDVQSASVGRGLCRALDQGKRQREATALLAAVAPVSAERAGGTGFVPAASAVIDTVANLFRTDYTIYGIQVGEDQNLFVREFARAFRQTGARNPVYVPGLFPLSPSTADNLALRRVSLLESLRSEAAEQVGAHQAQSAAFEQSLTVAGARTRELNDAKSGHDDAAKALEESIKAHDALLATVTTAADDVPAALPAIIRQARTAELLRSGGLLVVTNVHFIGGTSYSAQNFFTFLGGMPYHVSGGVLASYIVQDGRTGQVYDTVAVPVSGGYVRPTQLRRAVQRRPRR